LLTSISHTPPFVLNRSLTQFFVASNVTPLLAAVPLSQSIIFTNSVFCEPNDRVSRASHEAGSGLFLHRVAAKQLNSASLRFSTEHCIYVDWLASVSKLPSHFFSASAPRFPLNVSHCQWSLPTALAKRWPVQTGRSSSV